MLPLHNAVTDMVNTLGVLKVTVGELLPGQPPQTSHSCTIELVKIKCQWLHWRVSYCPLQKMMLSSPLSGVVAHAELDAELTEAIKQILPGMTPLPPGHSLSAHC